MSIAESLTSGTIPKWAMGLINTVLVGFSLALIGMVWTGLQSEITTHTQQIEKHGEKLSEHTTELRDHQVQLNNHNKQVDRIEAKLDQVLDELRRGK